MQTYRIINEDDPNDSFEVEAETAEGAALSALELLGWLLIEPENQD